MTHNELSERALNWLVTRKGCMVAATEIEMTDGRADAIGFKWREAILVEVKVSRNDFLADLKKARRILGERSSERSYYLTTPGVILSLSEVPENWGWIEFKSNKFYIKKEAEYCDVSERTFRYRGMVCLEIARRTAHPEAYGKKRVKIKFRKPKPLEGE